MDEALVLGLFWFPAERLEPVRRLPHVDISVVQGSDISEDINRIDRGGSDVDCICMYMSKIDKESG